MKNPGFTLIELLIVIAIVGILAGIFSWSLIRGIRSAELREAANQVASDFRRARSEAQRGSKDMVINWSSGTFTSYSLDGKDREISNSVTMTCISGCGTTAGADANSLTYMAPYGERKRPMGTILELRSPMNGITPMQVRIVGMTGKVMIGKGSS